MKRLTLAVLGALLAPAALAAPRGFTANDLVNLERVADPRLSPDGKAVAFQVRETDYAANKGRFGVWLLRLDGKSAPLRVTAKDLNATSPRWSPDGKSLYFSAPRDGVGQVWRVDVAAALASMPRGEVMRNGFDAEKSAAAPVTSYPIDVDNFKLAPDGKTLLVSLAVYTDCADLACTKQRLDAAEKAKASGRVYDKLFVRHWDTWADGRRSQLYAVRLDADGKAGATLKLLSRGIDGDVPSKPFGDDSEYAFSPDGKTVYFGARIAGRSEPWSTNFDLYSVPVDGAAAPKNLTAANPAWDAYPVPSPDGKTLYYLAMKRPGFEADRFGVMALDLASGSTRELAPQWDRSAGGLAVAADGKTLYASADDNGEHALFALDAKSGKVTRLSRDGDIAGFDLRGRELVVARESLTAPTDLYRLDGGRLQRLTHFNAERLKDVAMGAPEWFDFKGWNDERVQGYVVKPWNYEPGKKYPVAFIIHGGPQGAMTNDFHYRWNPQTYAGAGFAVVTINFHGSTGYGQAFTDAISRHWGDRPLEDLQKGWAAAQAKYAFLDGDQACALGASYGGFMVYWIAGNWSQPWKCLVDHDGVFDARMMGYSTEELWFDEWEHGGTQYDKPAAYEQFNPVNHVAKWSTPMLVVHGEKDFRIPYEQGLAAFTALQRRGIDSQFLVFPDENHWVLKPQNSVQWHDTVLAWLKRWTGGAAK